jgi:hypothetical protein
MHHVNVGNVAYVSELHTASVFRPKVGKANQCSYVSRLWSRRLTWRNVGNKASFHTVQRSKSKMGIKSRPP